MPFPARVDDQGGLITPYIVYIIIAINAFIFRNDLWLIITIRDNPIGLLIQL